jgi:hypothetical protein
MEPLGFETEEVLLNHQFYVIFYYRSNDYKLKIFLIYFDFDHLIIIIENSFLGIKIIYTEWKCTINEEKTRKIYDLFI